MKDLFSTQLFAFYSGWKKSFPSVEKRLVALLFAICVFSPLFADDDEDITDDRDYPDYDYLCFTNVYDGTGSNKAVTIQLKEPASLAESSQQPPTIHLQYSIITKNSNGNKVGIGTWVDYDISLNQLSVLEGIALGGRRYTAAPVITLTNPGDKVYFRAKTNNSSFGNHSGLTWGFYNFVMTQPSDATSASIDASGSIMSLLNKDCTGTSVPDYAFVRLFQNCSALRYAPELPAMTLGKNCYDYMFEDCDGLLSCPELPATQLEEYCYRHMFKNCERIDYIKVGFTEWYPTTATEDWMGGANNADSCVVVCSDSLDLSTRGDNYILSNWNHQSDQLLCFTALSNNSYIKLKKVGTPNAVDLVYAIKRPTNWKSLTIGESINLDTQNKNRIYIKAGTVDGSKSTNSVFTKDYNNRYQFEMGGSIKASGSIMSLLDGSCQSSVVPSNAFLRLFSACTKLKTAPELPASTVNFNGYGGMFNGCIELENAPELPATAIGSYAYSGMFTNCTSITYASDLPATQLASNCYTNMFKGCTALTEAPALPATKLATNCYQSMFEGCTNLSYIKVGFSTWPSNNATLNWVKGVADAGTFECPTDLAEEYSTASNNYSRIPKDADANLKWTVSSSSHFDYLCFSANQNGSAVWLEKVSSPNTAYIEYSIDNGGNWNAYTYGNKITLNVQSNPKRVYFRAAEYYETTSGRRTVKTAWGKNSTFSKDASNRYQFHVSGSISASGNVMSLLAWDGSATTVPANAFVWLFKGCANLKSAPQLPAVTLNSNCYGGMFNGCSSLSSAPELPATTLANYCYSGMFTDCSSLAIAPVLSATTLAKYCYMNMFKGCTSLKSAPSLPAKTLVTDCYDGMFQGCSLLSSMAVGFTDWSNGNNTTDWVNGVASEGTFIRPAELTEKLSNVSDGYHFIPEGWGSYSPDYFYIKPHSDSDWGFNISAYRNGQSVGASDIPFQYSTDGLVWYDGPVYNMPVSIYNGGSTIYLRAKNKMSSLNSTDVYYSFEIPNSDISGIECGGNIMSLIDPLCQSTSLPDYAFYKLFEGQKIIVQAPELPFTELGKHCYEQMFKGTGLTDAPALPATELKECCYSNMFENCISLTETPGLQSTTLANNCYKEMFKGCTNLNKITVNFSHWSPSDDSTNPYTTNWVQGVQTTSGTFVSPKTLSHTTSDYNDSRIPTNWKVQMPDYFQFISNESGSISVVNLRGTTDNPLRWTRDGSTWNEFPVNVTDYDTIYVVTTSTTGTLSTADDYYKFKLKGSFECAGNIRSLIDPTSSVETLEAYAFYHLFDGCTSLLNAPELPFLTMKEGCYAYMFNGCINLESSPVLPATSLAKDCYAHMFEGCEKLNKIKVAFTDWNDGGTAFGTTDWVKNVSEEGTFWCPENLDVSQHDDSHVPYGWTKKSPEYLKFTCTAQWGGNISYNGNDLSFSTDNGANWFVGPLNNPYLSNNGFVLVKAATDSRKLNSITIQHYFSMVNEWEVSGDIAFLIDPSGMREDVPAYAFYKLFQGCSTLKNAPALPSENIGNYAYAEMFSGCTSIDAAPTLPAETMSSCCYKGMFKGCTGLTSVPNLPATTLDVSCYEGMFENCTGITSAPNLSATQLATSCYKSMFKGCTGIVQAPELPAKTLVTDCYDELFYGCSNLSMITVGFPAWSTTANTTNWVAGNGTTRGVANKGLFVGPDEAVGPDAVPEGWTVVPTEGIIAKIPEPSDVITSGWNLYEDTHSYRPEIIDPLSNYTMKGYRVWSVENSTDLTLDVPKYDLVEKVLFVGTSSNDASTLKVNNSSQVLLAANNGDINYLTYTCYAESDENYGKDITISAPTGFYGFFYIYGKEKAHPTISVDYRTSRATITCSPSTARIKYWTSENSTKIDYSGSPVKFADIYSGNDVKTVTLYAQGFNGESPLTEIEEVDIYFYPKHAGYCLVQNVEELKSALKYASLAASENYRVNIFVANGTYDLGTTPMTEVGSYTSLIGQNKDKAIITCNPTSTDHARNATLYVYGTNVYLQDLTIKNENADAPAVIDAGTNNIYVRNNLMANQYTFYSKGDYKQQCYLLDDAISGTDNLFVGGGDIWVENAVLSDVTTLLVDKKNSQTKFGYLFKNCGTSNVGSNTITSVYGSGVYGLSAWTPDVYSTQKNVTSANYNGTTINITANAEVFYAEMVVGKRTDFTLCDSKTFHVDTDIDGATVRVRAANDFGGFGDAIEASAVTAFGELYNGLSAKLNTKGFGTFSHNLSNTALQPIGASAYTARYNNGVITLYHINSNDLIPANTGVILFGNANTTIQFNAVDLTNVQSSLYAVYYPTYKPTSAHDLQANLTDYVSSKSDGTAYLVLSSDDSFKRLNVNGGHMAANKAYFDMTGFIEDSGAAAFRMVFGAWDEEEEFETGIKELPLYETSDSLDYNLLGQRIKDQKGLIVKNNKVVLVK